MIHVCFGLHDADGRYSKFTGTAMVSLFENSSTPPQSITVHILHDNTLTDDNRDKFNQVAGRYGQLVKFYNVEKICADNLNELSGCFPNAKTHWTTIGALFKLLIADIFSDLDKVIYLDSDTIVNMDIAELWRITLDDKILGVVPEITNGRDVRSQFAPVADGRVVAEDYFNTGVMLMNLKLLRGETQTLVEVMNFVAQTPAYRNFMEQDLFNLCFSKHALKLPSKFNRFVDTALREDGGRCGQKIYHYVKQRETFGLNMDNIFQRLWMENFLRSPWFEIDTIGRLYEKIQEHDTEIKKLLINLSSGLNGKKRAFITFAAYVNAVKIIFGANDSEFLVVETFKDTRDLIRAMKKSRAEKTFLFIVENYKDLLNPLISEDFVENRDFFDGSNFLGKPQRFDLNTYRFVKAL